MQEYRADFIMSAEKLSLTSDLMVERIAAVVWSRFQDEEQNDGEGGEGGEEGGGGEQREENDEQPVTRERVWQ